MKSKKLEEPDTITEANVDRVIQQAIKKYFDIGMLVDAMFWQHCIGLLQNKYGFHLESTKLER